MSGTVAFGSMEELASDDAAEGPAAEERYAALFHAHFHGMVALATLLGADDPEDLAQEAFVRLHRRIGRMRDPNAALAYLRRTVVNLSHSRLRHLRVARRHAEVPPEPVDSAEQHAVIREDFREVVAALDSLSRRHREALVLRYWLDMTEAEMAEAMGVSPGTVKAHVSRGLAALAALMRTDDVEPTTGEGVR
jgi:RNA polymerase sigma-70 factor (sigma-E family)